MSRVRRRVAAVAALVVNLAAAAAPSLSPSLPPSRPLLPFLRSPGPAALAAVLTTWVQQCMRTAVRTCRVNAK